MYIEFATSCLPARVIPIEGIHLQVCVEGFPTGTWFQRDMLEFCWFKQCRIVIIPVLDEQYFGLFLLSSEAFPGEYTWQDQAAKGSHPYLDWCALECKLLHTTQEHDYRRTFSQTTQLHVLWMATFDFCGLLLGWFQTEGIQLQA